jgi:hypothetical protein
MKINLDTALEQYALYCDQCRSSLPKELTPYERDTLLKEMSLEFSLGRQHIEAIYKHSFYLGENMSGQIKFKEIAGYVYGLEGLGRHLLDGIQIVDSAFSVVKAVGEQRQILHIQALINHRWRKVL